MRRRRANQAHMASRSIRVEQAVATAAAAVKSWKDVGEQQLSLDSMGFTEQSECMSGVS